MSRPRIIITHKAGQLANHLNLFAQFIALARETGAVVLDPSFGKYASGFESTRHSLLCRYPARTIKLPTPISAGMRERAFRWAVSLRDAVRHRQDLTPPPRWTRGMQARVVEFGQPYVHMDDWTRADLPRRALLVNGYPFRARRLVEKHRPAIVDFFRPTARHRAAVDASVAAARGGTNDMLIGVHIRWGDYATYRGGEFFYELPTYLRLMRQARDAFAPRPVRFLVCNAERMDMSDFDQLSIAFGPGSAVGDLYALAACDAILGPPSSYSAWASFYGGAPLNHVYDPAPPLRADGFEPSPHPRTDWSEAEARDAA